MRALSFLLVAAVLATAGCEAVSQQMHDKFDPTPARTREFLADYRAVREAAQLAMRRIGYTLSRSAPGNDAIVGYSAIQPGDPTRSARQLRLTVTLKEIGPRQIDVELLMTEQLEGGMIGASGERPLREHGLYESYYVALQQILDELAAGGPAHKN